MGNGVDEMAYDSDARHVDVHLIVSYSPMTHEFTFERALGPVMFGGDYVRGQVYDWATREYQPNDQDQNAALIKEAGDQLESALRVINTLPAEGLKY